MSPAKIVCPRMSPFPTASPTYSPKASQPLSTLSRRNPKVKYVCMWSRRNTGTEQRKSGSKRQNKSAREGWQSKGERQGMSRERIGLRKRSSEKKIGENAWVNVRIVVVMEWKQEAMSELKPLICLAFCGIFVGEIIGERTEKRSEKKKEKGSTPPLGPACSGLASLLR